MLAKKDTGLADRRDGHLKHELFPIGNLWGIRLNDGTEVLGPNGTGLTKEVAEKVLNAIETRNCRSALVVPASPSPAVGAGV